MVPFQVDDWKAVAKAKRDLVVIPAQWRLDPQYLVNVNENSTICVLDVPQKCGILSPQELEITETKPSLLLQQLHQRTVSSYDVTLAFCKRAAIAHQLTNCLTDFLYEPALERARELDAVAKNGGNLGRLHGLPVSFKEFFNLANCDTTFGYVSWVGNKKTTDGFAVEVIKAAGAIPFCKTTISQGCLIVEGISNVYGTCLNPCNLSLTPAGSSSGEGALVKMKGTPLGIGSDGGGSVRLPAHSNGVFGFMPSTNRITSMGIGDTKMGLTWVQPQIGPLVNEAKMVSIWAQAMLDYPMHHYDSLVYGIEWRNRQNKETTKNATLQFGVVYHDHVTTTTPPMIRVLRQMAAKLKEKGYRVVEIDVGDLHRKITEIVFQMYVSSGLEGYKQSIAASGEPYVDRCCGSQCEGPMSYGKVNELGVQAGLFADKYLELFVNNNVDVILTPSSPNPAAPHGKYSTNSLSAVYNCLGYAAGIVPVGVVDLDLDKPNEEYLKSEMLPDLDIMDVFPYDYYDKYLKEELYTDVEVFKNAPLSVQVVGRKMCDEEVVDAMEILESLSSEAGEERIKNPS